MKPVNYQIGKLLPRGIGMSQKMAVKRQPIQNVLKLSAGKILSIYLDDEDVISYYLKFFFRANL